MTPEESSRQLRHDVIEGCREMAEIYLAIEREYHPLEEEAQRLMDSEDENSDDQ
jgi:hypothetical protein